MNPHPVETSSQPRHVIVPQRGWVGIDFRELWAYRELLFFLSWRDIRVRYAQTAVGVAWAVVQPLVTMVVFSIFFGRLAGLEQRTEGIPYPLFLFAGLLPWTFFANTVTGSSQSAISNANLITRVYFPRLLIPASSIGVGLLDWAVSAVLLGALMLYYGAPLSPWLLLLPLLVLGTVMAALGVGTLLAAAMISYRDLRFVVPFLLQIWLYISPVIYPSRLLSAEWRWVLALNPMSGLIDGFRAALLGAAPEPGRLGVSLAVSLLLFLAGAAYFRQVEDSFADLV